MDKTQPQSDRGSVLSETQTKAMELAERNKAVFAGKNSTGNGGLITIPASALKALERKGLLVLTTSPDGGLMGRPV